MTPDEFKKLCVWAKKQGLESIEAHGFKAVFREPQDPTLDPKIFEMTDPQVRFEKSIAGMNPEDQQRARAEFNLLWSA